MTKLLCNTCHSERSEASRQGLLNFEELNPSCPCVLYAYTDNKTYQIPYILGKGKQLTHLKEGGDY